MAFHIQNQLKKSLQKYIHLNVEMKQTRNYYKSDNFDKERQKICVYYTTAIEDLCILYNSDIVMCRAHANQIILFRSKNDETVHLLEVQDNKSLGFVLA